MVMACSIPITVTVNWAFHASELSWGAFSQYLYMYPLIFIIAIAVRFIIANPLVDKAVKHLLPAKLNNLEKALAITLFNILIMGSIVAFVRTLVVAGGLETFAWDTYATSLPLSFFISFCFGYFVASPLMKKVFARMVEPRVKLHHAAHGKPLSTEMPLVRSIRTRMSSGRKAIKDRRLTTRTDRAFPKVLQRIKA